MEAWRFAGVRGGALAVAQLVVLLSVSLLVLAGCGGETTETPAGPAATESTVGESTPEPMESEDADKSGSADADAVKSALADVDSRFANAEFEFDGDLATMTYNADGADMPGKLMVIDAAQTATNVFEELFLSTDVETVTVKSVNPTIVITWDRASADEIDWPNYVGGPFWKDVYQRASAYEIDPVLEDDLEGEIPLSGGSQ
jgi:hypothetical protein